MEKVVELGLVGDRRELRKKRRKKGGSGDGADSDGRRLKNKSGFTELADLVSDEHSSSESMHLFSQKYTGSLHLSLKPKSKTKA